ncbi:MAG: acyltransferase family protein [Paludibacter sp.]
MLDKQRISLPDTTKGIAVLLMIQVHIMELFAKQEIYDSSRGSISLFFGGIPAAPIFLLLMGYFLAYSKKRPTEIALRGVRLFFGGLLLNIGLNLNLLYKIFYENWNLNPLHYVFGADILTLAGLSLLCFAIIQKITTNRYFIYFGLAIVIALASHFIYPNQFEDHSLRYIFSFFVGGTSWSFFPLVPWLSFPLLGFGIKLLNDKLVITALLNKSWSKYIIATLTLILVLTLNIAITITNNLAEYYHFDFLFFLWSISFIICWLYLLYYIEKKFRKTLVVHYLQFLGKNVTVVYVIQWLIIGNLATTFYKSKEFDQWALWVLFITIAASSLTYLWVKLRTFIVKKYFH